MSQLITIKSHAGFGAETSALPPEDAITIRPSSYSNWALCGYRELLRGEPGYEAGSNSAPGVGTGIHGAIDHFLDTGELLSRDEVLPFWAKTMAERGEDLWSYADEQFLTELSYEIQHALMAWYNGFWLPHGSTQETLAHEERIMRGLGVLPSGREVWVSGQADRVVPAEVQDWKTASRGWKAGKANSNSVQVNAYAWLMEHITDATRGTFVVYDRSKRTWSWDDTSLILTPTTKHMSLLALWDMAVSLDTGVAVATPTVRGGFGDGIGWHCSPKFCPAWNVCPFGPTMIEDRTHLTKTIWWPDE